MPSSNSYTLDTDYALLKHVAVISSRGPVSNQVQQHPNPSVCKDASTTRWHLTGTSDGGRSVDLQQGLLLRFDGFPLHVPSQRPDFRLLIPAVDTPAPTSLDHGIHSLLLVDVAAA